MSYKLKTDLHIAGRLDQCVHHLFTDGAVHDVAL